MRVVIQRVSEASRITSYNVCYTKLLRPFWIIGLLELTLGLILARLIFNVPILGNIAIIYLVAAVYLVLVLGIGLIISTMSDTQQRNNFV